MDELEEKLGSILNDPGMMQKIMSMAQMLSQPQTPEPPPQQPTQPLTGSVDPAMLQKVYSIARQSGIDRNQQALLKALTPYLSHTRIAKLEKAMRAAKIAGIAGTALEASGFSLFSGR